MRKTISSKQLEGMIAQCVGQVIAESKQNKQQKPQSKVLNESQLQEYINNVINEEIEKEGFLGRAWGGLKGAGNAIRGEFNKAKHGVTDTGLSNEYQGQSFGSRLGAAKKMVSASAKQGDMAQELNNLKDLLYKLELNGYFNKAVQPIANKLYNALDAQIQSGENLQVKGTYKKGYGQSMPQSQPQSNGMARHGSSVTPKSTPWAGAGV